ncbi:MAG: RecQ family zinc-binding domain-containing protein [Bacteroidetes bacterium]|nr:RecQ family zinc-binding domain-containing protein [Bacteroidota bacterium]
MAHGSGEGESFDFDMEVFCEAYQLERMAAFNSLKLLEQFGWISLSDAAYIPPRLMVVVNKEELYNFQLKNEKLEPLIKLILRNHGGAFDQYVRLNIAQLAMKLDEDKKQIISELQHIHQMGIIKYEGSKDKPQLTFIHARPNRLDTVVDKIYYEQRKKTYKEKINAVIQYVSNRDTCRSVQLLAYFDEKKKQKCGVCDVCQDRHRTALLPKEYEQVEEQVNQLLHQNDMEMSELVPQIKGVREELTIKAIRWMLDNSILNIKDDKLTLV